MERLVKIGAWVAIGFLTIVFILILGLCLFGFLFSWVNLFDGIILRGIIGIIGIPTAAMFFTVLYADILYLLWNEIL